MPNAALAETRTESRAAPAPSSRTRLELPRRPAFMGRKPEPAEPASARPQRDLNTPEFIAAIESALEDLRPRLKADGGDCCLAAVEGDKVWVHMTGACAGCQLASMTIAGVRMKIVEKLGFPVKVVPV